MQFRAEVWGAGSILLGTEHRLTRQDEQGQRPGVCTGNQGGAALQVHVDPES